MRTLRKIMSESIKHEGIVESVSGGSVHVKIAQASACSACQVKGSCMAADAQEKYIDCNALEVLQAGDRVVVEVERSLGWLAVLLAFVFPFLLLMLVLCIGNMYLQETVAGTIALCSLLPYYAVLALFKGRIKKKFRFTARRISATE